MKTTPDTALDNLTRIVQVVRHDRALRQWFAALSQQPAPARRAAIFGMCEQMAARNEDPGLVTAFRLLADDNVFDATRLALNQ
jgi:hypothetical protein